MIRQIPVETLCPACNTVFKQAPRKHGGGMTSIYCSARCRSRYWAQGNKGKRTATILKYEAIPENKLKKKERALKYKFEKYGISSEDFNTQLERQANTCYGCSTHIDQYSARIDHNHKTGKVRGLLCDNCNWALGHLKDSRETCYKLSAYLDYNREKKSIYLIGSLRNESIPVIAKQLRSHDFDVWDEWYSAGPTADDSFQNYQTALGVNFRDALKSEVAQHIFYFDKAHLDLCDYGILVMPAGKSGHLELGYMAAKGKKTFILLDAEPDRFDIMPQFATGVCNNMDELIKALD